MMPIPKRVREGMLEAAKHYRAAFALWNEAIADWRNHLKDNPPLKAHLQSAATRESREALAVAASTEWTMAMLFATTADTTRQNAHLLLNSIYTSLGFTDADFEEEREAAAPSEHPPTEADAPLEERPCAACTKHFPVGDLYTVQFKDADGPVILCSECYKAAQAEGREVAYIGPAAPSRPQPPAEDADDKTPDPHPGPLPRGEGETVEPDFTPEEKAVKRGEEEGDDA